MADENGVDTASMPKTEAYTPIFDTGAHPKAEPRRHTEPEPNRLGDAVVATAVGHLGDPDGR